MLFYLPAIPLHAPHEALPTYRPHPAEFPITPPPPPPLPTQPTCEKMAAVANTKPKPHNELKIIHASLFRMGTCSMAQAYQALGYKTFHALDEGAWPENWVELEKAAEATWPWVPRARARPPFTRDDWDRLWGAEYDVVCDTSAPFTLQLLRAYPDAKVVVVQRDFDSWWPSFQSLLLDRLFMPCYEIQTFLVWHLVGLRAGHAMMKVILGFFHATNKAEVLANGRETYERFFREIRECVPPERRLEYKLGSGWGPLCQFLGKDVPRAPFPMANDRRTHTEDFLRRKRDIHIAVLKAGVLVILGVLSFMMAGVWCWFLI